MEVVRGYLHNHETEDVRRHMEEGAAAIAEMVPHLKEHLGDLPELTPLDDLHWADGPSLLMVEFLAHRLGETKVLVVGTYRDVEVRRTHPLQQTLGT